MNNRVLQEMFGDRAARGCRHLRLHARHRTAGVRRAGGQAGHQEAPAAMLAETTKGKTNNNVRLRPERTPGPGPRRAVQGHHPQVRPHPRGQAAHGRPVRPARTTRPHDRMRGAMSETIRERTPRRGRHGAARRAACQAGDRAGHRPRPGRRPDAGGMGLEQRDPVRVRRLLRRFVVVQDETNRTPAAPRRLRRPRDGGRRTTLRGRGRRARGRSRPTTRCSASRAP